MTVRCYIALGCNLGRRELQLRAAIGFLDSHGVKVVARSRVYETAALLPAGAPERWNIAYLNQVVEAEASLSPEALLTVLKRCETAMGRQERERWGPRELDCDLLLYGNEVVSSDTLTVPHAELHKRDFVLVPLADIAAEVEIPVTGNTVRGWLAALDASAVRTFEAPRPKLMGIVNVTPDSFSGAGDEGAVEKIGRLLKEGADIIDIGGESTRPGAVALSADEEWARIGPLVRGRRDWVMSMDTYHVDTARKVLAAGVGWINDVSGARDEAMLGLVAEYGATLVLMHSLTVPVNPNVMMQAKDPVAAMISWAQDMVEIAEKSGVAVEKLVLDPGIGFGKTALQSLDLLMHMEEIVRAVPQVRWLVGHSRKSFMKLFSDMPAPERDGLTLALSATLMDSGVDYLRVHDVAGHRALVDGWPA